MRKLLLAAGLISLPAISFVPGGPAQAVICSGTITTVADGGFVAGSVLVDPITGLSTGNCVEAADKIFGNFSVGGAITGGGTTGWLFTGLTGPADVTLSFQGLVPSNSSGTVDYSVSLDLTKSNGAQISELEKDFTFNSLGAGSTATLTGTTTPAASSFSGGDITTGFQCTRTSSGGTCPDFGFFSPTLTSLTVDETITTGPNTNVTALTDTIFQVVPEPASLGLLGVGLLALGIVRRRVR